ncbi:MAG: glutamate--tRNA ligase family protein [Bacteroidota bacterium]
MNFNRFRKTRIAPTPSGYCHLGNAYSFLLTQSMAHKTGAKILLRIDDLDRERFREEYLNDIFETLEFLEIGIVEGPSGPDEFHSNWSQVNRMTEYREALDRLKASGKVFGCRCSRSELSGLSRYPGTCKDKALDFDAAETAWRLIGDERPVMMRTTGGQNTADLPEEMMQLVVRKKDRNPSYHLASVVDDLMFGVDLVVRGADLLPSTLGQLSLARQLGAGDFGEIVFVHHPILSGADGLKLSKSAGSDAVRAFRRKGIRRADIIERIGEIIGDVDWLEEG